MKNPIVNTHGLIQCCLWLSALFVITTSAGCKSMTYSLLTTTHNVTNDITGKSGYIPGQIYETTEKLYVVSYPEATLPNFKGMYLTEKSTWDTPDADRNDQNYAVKYEGILPIGTRIQFEKAVTFEFPRALATNYYGRFLNGEFAHKSVVLNGISTGNREVATISYYSPNSAYLKKVNASIK